MDSRNHLAGEKSGRSGRDRPLEHIAPAGVHNLCAVILPLMPEIEPVAFVYVAVRHEGGVILVHQAEEAGEAPVREVVVIPDAEGRRVRQ